MIFSCWGSFQREVFWLKLILRGGDVGDDVDDEMIVTLMMMTRRKTSFGISSLFNVCESYDVVAAPNWMLTRLKCIANASYFICIAMHFL